MQPSQLSDYNWGLATFGLDHIILYSSPLLSFIYPLETLLIFLGLLRPLIGKNPLIYKTTLGLTFILELLDAIHTLPPLLINISLFKTINA
ncbi:branched-chain amino acid transport system II carrier protein [Furfurilactobacillus curtus]